MIDVFIDTNILHSRNEQLDKALFVEKLKEIIGEIEINDIYKEIKNNWNYWNEGKNDYNLYDKIHFGDGRNPDGTDWND